MAVMAGWLLVVITMVAMVAVAVMTGWLMVVIMMEVICGMIWMTKHQNGRVKKLYEGHTEIHPSRPSIEIAICSQPKKTFNLLRQQVGFKKKTGFISNKTKQNKTYIHWVLSSQQRP